MGGLNETDRLRAAGIKAKKASVSRVALGSFVVVQKGPAAHPRAHLPVDPALVEHIKAHGVPTEERRFRAREDGDRLEVIDGARRHKAGTVAEAWLRKHQPRQPPLEWDRSDESDPGQLFVDTQIVICSDLDLILERLDANVSRGLPDSASVLAATVAQIVRLNKGEPDEALMGRIVARMPRGIGPAEVLALARWDNLAAELQARFESGEAPIGLLVPVLAARAEERAATLDRLLAQGVRTAKGATRAANKAKDTSDPWARRMTPRQAVKVAEVLAPIGSVVRNDDAAEMFRCGIATGLRMAAGINAGKIVKALPKPIADAVREARAGKRGAR